MSIDKEKGVKTMAAATTVQKWGNSLAVRIPAHIAEQVAFKQGAEIELTVLNDNEIRLTPVQKDPTLAELLAKITPENKHQEIDFESEGDELI